MKSPQLRSFVAAHGIDPITDGVEWGWDYEEDVLSTEPFEARFTYTVADDAITLVVNDDLEIVDVTPAAPR